MKAMFTHHKVIKPPALGFNKFFRLSLNNLLLRVGRYPEAVSLLYLGYPVISRMRS